MTRVLLLVVVAALALAAPSAALAAAQPPPRTTLSDVEDEVMCDTCNVPLDIADSPRADQERREIQALIARGLTKDQVKAELRSRYGPQILALPPDDGFSVTAYVVPVAVVVALLALAAFTLPRWRRRAPASAAAAAAPAAPELSAADAARLDEDLARWDRR